MLSANKKTHWEFFFYGYLDEEKSCRQNFLSTKYIIFVLLEAT